MANNTSLPPFDLPISGNGPNNYVWYRFLIGLWQAYGGGNANPTTLPEVAAEAAAAKTLAISAQSTANLADVNAINAESAAGAAKTTANNANSTANAVNSQLINYLLKSNNLNDLPNSSIARTNLGVAIDGLPFHFASCSSIDTIYLPIIRNYVIPTNFVGSGIWSGSVSTSDATFTVSYLRGGPTAVPIILGTLGLIHSGNYPNIWNCPQFNLLIGDVLSITCPSDATLAKVGITLRVSLA